MPEKIADSPANGAARPVPAKTPEEVDRLKIAQTTRRYVQEAEKVGGDAFRVYNDLMSTTANYYFDALDKTMHETMELTTHVEHAMEDMMTIYRRTFTDGFKAWQGYWQDVNKMLPRPK